MISSFSSLVFSLLLALTAVSVSGLTLYDFTVKDAAGNEVSLQKYSHAKVILIVNTARSLFIQFSDSRKL